MEITRQELHNKVISRQRLNGEPLDILCESVNAITYQDIYEIYLFLSGVKNYRWVDQKGGKKPSSSVSESIIHLIRDLTGWPLFYFHKSYKVNNYISSSRRSVLPENISSILFLRTDHWFGINSGGSVAHLNGVVGGFRSSGYRTNVLSSDVVPGLQHEDFNLCDPAYGIGRNLPNFPEILYTDTVVKFAERRWSSWEPSFIYQRYSLGNFSGVILKSRFGVPLICEYNGSFVWMSRQWSRKKLFHEGLINKIEILNLQAADLVVVVSQPMKVELNRRGIHPDKILVNPNGVDPEQYSPDINGCDIHSAYELNGKIVVGFIGTFGPWHGVEVLAEAFGRLIINNSYLRDRVRLMLIGDGDTMPQVKSILEKFGVLDLCVFTGTVAQDEGPRYLAACDLLILPTIPNPDGTPFFGSPTKLFEYMAMGKGIVASGLDQIGEVLQHGSTAWIVQPGDVNNLVGGIKYLIEDHSLRKRLGQAAREEVIQQYTWHHHTQRILDRVYEL